MNNVKTSKKSISVKAAALVLALIFSTIMLCSGCGKQDPMETYSGTWVGSAGTTFLLRSNGTVRATQPKWKSAASGTWSIDGDRLNIEGVYKYPIYASIADSKDTLIFEANNSKWNVETFTRSE